MSDDDSRCVVRNLEEELVSVERRNLPSSSSANEEKESVSTPNNPRVVDLDGVIVKTPSQLQHRPLYCYPYQFTRPDVIVFKGLLFLTFDKEEDVGKKLSLVTGAYCELCDTTLEFDKKRNPHTVVNHVRRVHPKRMAQLLQEKAERESDDSRLKKKPRIQSSLKLFAQTEASKMPMATPQQQATFRYKASVWVGARLLPFARVQDSELQDMIDYACTIGKRQLKLPSRQETSLYVACIAQAIRECMKELMTAEVDYYALTTDMWTSRTMDAYLATTMHYLTDNFRLKQYTLDINPFEGRHTADLIRMKMSDSLFKKWGLKKGKLAMMVCDGGSNIVKACRDMSIPSILRIGHQFHLLLAPLCAKPKKSLSKKKLKNPPSTSNSSMATSANMASTMDTSASNVETASSNNDPLVTTETANFASVTNYSASTLSK
jgi:hypothetical protein